MTPSARFVFPALAVLLLGPATSAWPADPPAAPAPLLPDSSIAAVLARRTALELTPEQVKQLEQVQAELARQQRSAREEAAAPPDPGATGASPGKPGGTPPVGMGGAKARPPPNIRASGPDPAQVLEQRLDALDTEAFLKAVELLPEAQREKAIDVASRYREQLFEQRERERRR